MAYFVSFYFQINLLLNRPLLIDLLIITRLFTPHYHNDEYIKFDTLDSITLII
jgi:hypothetical protein